MNPNGRSSESTQNSTSGKKKLVEEGKGGVCCFTHSARLAREGRRGALIREKIGGGRGLGGGRWGNKGLTPDTSDLGEKRKSHALGTGIGKKRGVE